MPYLFVHEKIADYAKWRQVYDGLTATKSARGFVATHVLRNTADAKEIVILETWRTLEEAKSWGQSQELRAAMKEAGVLPTPVVLFLDEP